MGSPSDPQPSTGNLPSPTKDGCIAVQGTPEHREKNQPPLEWLARREAAYARLTAGEKEFPRRGVESVQAGMNENYSGDRKPYGAE